MNPFKNKMPTIKDLTEEYPDLIERVKERKSGGFQETIKDIKEERQNKELTRWLK